MSRRLLRWAKVVGTAVIVAVSPMFIAEYVLTHHALNEGRAEVRRMAEGGVERAEAVMGEGVGLLRALAAEGRADCSLANRRRFAAAVRAARFVEQIGIVDAGGTPLCAEPYGALALEFALPPAAAGDPPLAIGVLGGAASPERAAVATIAIADGLRLALRFRNDALNTGDGPRYLASAHRTRVFLDDGSEWSDGSAAWQPESEREIVTAVAYSAAYPLRVIVSASAEAMQLPVLALRHLSIVASAVFGFLACAVTLWITWSRDAASDDFTRAVEREEFVPYYQPVMNIATGALEGCEVLVRWVRPDGTIVPPGSFLPYSEATGLIREITRSLMRQTVADLGALYAVRPGLKMGINLTASHFIDHRIVDEVRAIYEGTGIDFRQLVFEVTEQHPLKDIALARTIIARIQRLGASVALDDVGTGHGGLAYLQQLGVDILKIDKLFIDKLGEDMHSDKIVDSLVELANTLGMGIVAEGVETEAQVELLRRIGVTSAQGYLFARPLPAAEFRERILATTPVPEVVARAA